VAGGDRFDLGGIDVLAAGDEHVLDPVDDREVTVLVTDSHVSGAEPASSVKAAAVASGFSEKPGVTLGPLISTSPDSPGSASDMSGRTTLTSAKKRLYGR
jgi:hypothetical protein